MTIGETGIDVDFAGTSGVVGLRHQRAGLLHRGLCLVRREVHRGAQGAEQRGLAVGDPRHRAARAAILNAQQPAPVAARHVTGQMLPDVMFGCLHQALGGGVPAEGTSCLWNLFGAGRPGPRPTAIRPRPSHAKPFNVMSFHAGGTGARPGSRRPVGHRLPERRAQRADRGQRGGVADRRLDARSTARIPAAPASSAAGWARSWRSARSTRRRSRISAYYDRIDHPARGREGGQNGTAGAVTLVVGHGAARQGPADRAAEGPRDHRHAGRRRAAAIRASGRRRSVAEDVRQGFISSRGGAARLRRRGQRRRHGRRGRDAKLRAIAAE